MGCFRQVFVRAALCSFLLLSAASLQAVSVAGNAGLTVTVSSDGSYQIAVLNPAWQFAGSMGGSPSNVAVQSGIDATGARTAKSHLTFTRTLNGMPPFEPTAARPPSYSR
jgi:hypothetical protein